MPATVTTTSTTHGRHPDAQRPLSPSTDLHGDRQRRHGRRRQRRWPPVTWSFTTASAPCPTTSPSGAVRRPPPRVVTPTPTRIELGVKFRSRRRRLHHRDPVLQGPDNTGTHVGHLWTHRGTLLATATFTSETATGWQQVTFSSPVAITANTTYVASYHTDTGNYAEDVNYFANNGVSNGPSSRWLTGSTAAMASSLRAPPPSRRAPSTRTTTGLMSSSARPGPGGDDDDAGLLRQPVGLRPVGDVHGHGHARLGRRHAHRHGHLHGRQATAGHGHPQAAASPPSPPRR